MPKIDTETGERTTPQQFQEDFLEHHEMLQFFSHVENNFITITVTEYHLLPNYLKEAWNVYRSIKNKLTQAQA